MSTLFIIAAPSGAGKTSLVNALLQQDPGLSLSISYTTRPKRVGEREGESYYFATEAEFLELQAKGEFLESAEVFGYRYGTSARWVDQTLQRGKEVILEIDWKGAQQVRAKRPCVTIFILPPSFEILRHRLEQRNQDHQSVIERRLQEAREEVRHIQDFDYWMVNDSFDQALQDLQAIIRATRLQKSNHQKQVELVLRNFEEGV